jgi:hypothetical protein
MRRTFLGTAAAMALLGGCAREPEHADTTTLTSGTTPAGVKATDAPLGDARPELRLAAAICRREQACGRVGREWPYGDVATCVRGLGAYVGEQIASWDCSPAAARARFEECMTSIGEEPCTTIVDRAERLPTCRANAVCGR